MIPRAAQRVHLFQHTTKALKEIDFLDRLVLHGGGGGGGGGFIDKQRMNVGREEEEEEEEKEGYSKLTQ